MPKPHTMKKLLTLFSAIIICTSVNAQIPNASFEIWDSSAGYKVPVSWETADSITYLLDTLTCEQGNPGFSGNHYLKLTSKTIPLVGAAAGIAVSGKIDFTTYLPRSGFAYTGRPTALTGEWQYAPAASTDTGVVAVGLTKWNTGLNKRDTVGYAYYKPLGSVTTWTAFSIPITYLTSETPDTAEIYLASSGLNAVNGSYMYVDTLAFSGASTGITVTNDHRDTMFVSPYPSNGVFTINITSGVREQAQIVVTNIVGEKIKEITSQTNNPEHINLDAPAGVYFINAHTINDHWSQKIVIVR